MHTLIDRGEGEVVVQELAKLHEHQGVSGVEVGDVGVDDNRNKTRGGKWLGTNGPEALP